MILFLRAEQSCVCEFVLFVSYLRDNNQLYRSYPRDNHQLGPPTHVTTNSRDAYTGRQAARALTLHEVQPVNR